jgi:cytochrome b561
VGSSTEQVSPTTLSDESSTFGEKHRGNASSMVILRRAGPGGNVDRLATRQPRPGVFLPCEPTAVSGEKDDVTATRHHRKLVTLHWVLAALTIAMLTIGFLWLRPMPNSDPRKIEILAVHISGGLLILAILLARFMLPGTRSETHRRGRLAAATHHGLYILLALLVATGATTAFRARLPAVLWSGKGDMLPARFTIFPTFIAHTLLAEVLVLLIVIHLVAALFHQFVLKDHLLSLMSYRANSLERAAPTIPADATSSG